MQLSDFELGAQLGEGSYGTVYECTHISSKRQFALKVFVTAQVLHHKNCYGKQEVMTEKKALIALDGHPSFVSLHYTFQDDSHLYLVIELACGGALFDEIRRLGSCHVDCARWLTAELVNALEFMHSKRICHRDLKPENILLDEVGHIKLIDFGTARFLDSSEPCNPFVGTAEYLCPELLRDEEALEAADLWALGCILFQMLSGSPPFQVPGSPMLTMELIKAMEFSKPESLDALPEHARSLVLELLHPEPTQRLGAPGSAAGEYNALRAHRFFCACEPPIDFASLTTSAPPPLVPPPPLPSIRTDGSVLNHQVALRGPLSRADRLTLLESPSPAGQWAPFLDRASCELLVLSTPVLKRRHLSVKRRQLMLIEGLPLRDGVSDMGSINTPTAAVESMRAAAIDAAIDGTAGGGPAATINVSEQVVVLGHGSDSTPTQFSSGGAAHSPGLLASTCRLIYVDPATLEYKGSIPWSDQLHAELLPRGQFRIHTPGRTYYLEDASGDEAIAELWVQTICSLQARPSPPTAGQLPSSPAPAMQPARFQDVVRGNESTCCVNVEL